MADDAAPRAEDDPATPTRHARFHIEETEPAVVHVEGEVDAGNGIELQALLDRAFETSPDVVIVEMSGLDFIDSVGLGVLVTAHNRGATEGIGFQIHDLPDHCRRVFEITSLVDVLDLR
jgi:anti-sigma B factor antagonist